MSFGFSIGDIAALTGLAWRTVQKCRKAGSQHEELTDQVTSVHLVLQRFEREMLASNSTMQGIDDTYREEIGKIVRRCQKPLRLMDKLLERYNGLRDERKSIKDLYQRVRFSNGEIGDLQELRTTLTHQTNTLTLYLNIILVGASGRVERQLNESGKELREMKTAVNGIAASLIMKAPNEGSVLTSYTQDDGEVWRKFRRALISKGFKSSFLRKNEPLIHAYLEELSCRGALDDPELTDTAPQTAHLHNDDMGMANAQPEPLVNKGDPQVGSAGSRKGHQNLDSQGKDSRGVNEKATEMTLPDHKPSNGSDKIILIHTPEISSSRAREARRLRSMQREESPLIPLADSDSESEELYPWATEEFLSTWRGRIYMQLLRYRRLHAVSLSPFFTRPPYSFHLKIETCEYLDCGNSSNRRRLPLQLAMHAPWAKPNFWLYPSCTGETLQNWHRWQRSHEPAVERSYVETSQMFERFFLASPWGICLIYCGYNVSLLFADLEFVSRVVGHAGWQRLYCMGPKHHDIWVSLKSKPKSLWSQYLMGSAANFVPRMDFLIWKLTECLTSEEDVSEWVTDCSAEGEGPPSMEDVNGLACLGFVAKLLTIEPPFSYEYFRRWMADMAHILKTCMRGDSLPRLVDLCIDVDRAHIQEKHSTKIPCRIKY